MTLSVNSISTIQAETALQQASRLHEAKAKELETRRAALERQLEREETRWDTEKGKLENALRRARS